MKDGIDDTAISPSVDPSFDADLSLDRTYASIIDSGEEGHEEARLSQAGDDAEVRYEVEDEIGAGGMGTVFKVWDKDLKRNVAFKTLRDQRGASRFIRESRITGQLNHPYIIPLHDIGLDDSGSLYISMQFVDGYTLTELMEKLRADDPEFCEKFTLERRLELFLKVLAAIQLAHEKGVIHRDLKPSNIMIGKYDEVFVLDWGLATYFEDHKIEALEDSDSTKEGTVLGTPRYMSPEQASGVVHGLTPTTDIYSLCAILYELLTLEHYLGLNDESNRFTYMHAVASKMPVFPSDNHKDGRPRVSRWLGMTVMKGLYKKPEERFQTVSELAKEIRGYISRDRKPICYTTSIQWLCLKLVQKIDHHPYLAGLIAICLSVFALIGFILLARALL